MKLGLIVLPSSNEEMQTVLEALNEAGVGYLAAAGIDAAAEGKPTKKTGKKAAKKPEPEEDEEDIDDFEDEEAEQEELKVPTGPELKKAFTDLRDSEGADVCKEILTSFGAKGLKDLDKDDWAAAYAACLEAAKGDADSDEDEEDDFDDFEDEDGDDVEAPDADTVKEACQKWAQKSGKEKPTAALKKNGLNTVRGLKAASDEVLAGIYKMVPAEFK